MNIAKRLASYKKSSTRKARTAVFGGDDTPVTPGQRRRLKHKENRAKSKAKPVGVKVTYNSGRTRTFEVLQGNSEAAIVMHEHNPKVKSARLVPLG